MSLLVKCQDMQFDEQIDSLTLSISSATISCITGPLRSGKTSLLMTLAGVNPPISGELEIFGLKPAALSKQDWLALRRSVGYVLPNSALISHLPVLQNVTLPLLYHKLASPQQANDQAIAMLTWLGCKAPLDLLPSAITEHDKRLVNIARALIMEPRILYIDEAFAYLDALSRKQFIQLYQTICQEKNLSLVLATHDLHAASICADQFIFIANKNILYFDSWSQCLNSDHPTLVEYRESSQQRP